MASQKNFAITPSVSISRSKFRRPSQHKTSFNLGELVPIYVDSDILPGDTVSMDLATLVRMSTPYAPLLDNIYIDYYAFFVPNRILWPKWKEFMGENESTAGAVLSEPAYPTIGINVGTGFERPLSITSLGSYMGLPVGLASTAAATDANAVLVSRLPGTAYMLTYSEWFRDQNLIAPFRLNTSNGNSTYFGTDGSTYLSYASNLLKVAKESDYFTRALPFAQKGSPVKLPLGDKANIILARENGTLSAASNVYLSPTNTIDSSNINTIAYAKIDGTNQAKVFADLSTATAATINQLRFAFQYQKFLEKDALYGTRLNAR